MDPQTLFITLLTFLAFGIPLLLLGAHVAGRGWMLGPPLYAGIVECLATYAVIARGSGFFDSQINEVSTGYFSRDTYIALFTASMGSLALLVFAFVVPQIRNAVEEILGHLKSLLLPRHNTPSSSFAIDLDEVTPLNAFAKAKILLAQLTWAVTRVCLGSLFILAYFGWPAALQEMDLHHQAEAELAQQEQSAAADRARSVRRRQAREEAARSNELYQGLERRQGYCKSDACSEVWQRRMAEMKIDFLSLGLNFTSHSDSDEFANKLVDDDKLDAAHTKIDDIARKFRIRFTSTSNRRELAAPDLISLAANDEARKRDIDSHVAQRVFAMAGNPKEIFATLSRDVTTLLCVLMEAIAVLLAFVVPLRKDR